MPLIVTQLVTLGAVVAQIFDRDFAREIGVGKTEEFSITLPYKAYAASVKGNNSIKVAFLGGVRLSKQTYAGQAVVDFDKPSIKIEVGDGFAASSLGNDEPGHYKCEFVFVCLRGKFSGLIKKDKNESISIKFVLSAKLRRITLRTIRSIC